jgi:branched-chain amino acid transport system ATP-binding protein
MLGSDAASVKRLPAAGASARPLLSVRDLTMRFGGLTALNGVSFDARRHEILAIIGPNGAGKTTLFNCLSGLCRPARGEILFDGRNLFGAPAHRIARMGVARTFQTVALFDSMTVADNIRVGAETDTVAGSIIDRFDLRDAADRNVMQIPLHLQRRVEIARALAAKPRLLLLDEPAAGLSAEEVTWLSGSLRGFRDEGMTILLVEHRMNFVLPLADKVLVLDFGKVIAEGSPEFVRTDPAVIRAYLGDTA